MKSFNQSIKIEVSVDSIANMLLDTMSPDYKHRETVTECIIGRMLAEDMGALSHLYNSLNGHLEEVDFKVGDVIVPQDVTTYGHWGEPNEAGVRASIRKPIERATVVEVNKYATEDLVINFDIPDSGGTMRVESRKIAHTRCKKLAI